MGKRRKIGVVPVRKSEIEKMGRERREEEEKKKQSGTKVEVDVNERMEQKIREAEREIYNKLKEEHEERENELYEELREEYEERENQIRRRLKDKLELEVEIRELQVDCKLTTKYEKIIEEKSDEIERMKEQIILKNESEEKLRKTIVRMEEEKARSTNTIQKDQKESEMKDTKGQNRGHGYQCQKERREYKFNKNDYNYGLNTFHFMEWFFLWQGIILKNHIGRHVTCNYCGSGSHTYAVCDRRRRACFRCHLPFHEAKDCTYGKLINDKTERDRFRSSSPINTLKVTKPKLEDSSLKEEIIKEDIKDEIQVKYKGKEKINIVLESVNIKGSESGKDSTPKDKREKLNEKETEKKSEKLDEKEMEVKKSKRRNRNERESGYGSFCLSQGDEHIDYESNKKSGEMTKEHIKESCVEEKHPKHKKSMENESRDRKIEKGMNKGRVKDPGGSPCPPSVRLKQPLMS